MYSVHCMLTQCTSTVYPQLVPGPNSPSHTRTLSQVSRNGPPEHDIVVILETPPKSKFENLTLRAAPKTVCILACLLRSHVPSGTQHRRACRTSTTAHTTQTAVHVHCRAGVVRRVSSLSCKAENKMPTPSWRIRPSCRRRSPANH